MQVEILSDAPVDDELRASIDAGMAFVAAYTREHTPTSVTFYASANTDYLHDNYRRVVGTLQEEARASLGQPGSGVAYDGVIFMNPTLGPDHPGYLPNLPALVTHEFFHTAQGSMTGKSPFSDRDYPAWMNEGTAQLMASRNDAPGGLDVVGLLGVIDLGTPFPGLQAWEEGSDSGFYSTLGTYDISAALIALYTEHVGLTDQAWAVDLWLNINANNQDWRAAWTQTYGTPVEDFYAWADIEFDERNSPLDNSCGLPPC